MGQNNTSVNNDASSLSLGLPESVGTVQRDLFRQARFLTEITSLSYEEFQTRLLNLNQLSRKCLDSEGNHLIFAVKRGSDKTLLWKGTVKIACVQMNFHTSKVVSYRLLSLSQFLKVFTTLHSQFLAAEKSRDDVSSGLNLGLGDSASSSVAMADMYPNQESLIRSTNDNLALDGPVSTKNQLTMLGVSVDLSMFEEFENVTPQECTGECCICLERKPEVLLPCTHSYCLPCIEQWNVNNKTCPICRETLESTDDTWVMSEAPGVQEICSSLMELSKPSPLQND